MSVNSNLQDKVIKNKGFSNFALKIIAMVFMVIDHLTHSLFLYSVPIFYRLKVPINKIIMIEYFFRGLGRFSFPIFAFLIAEGYSHTRNFKKYAISLFIFSFISEFPFDLAVFGSFQNWSHQNVFFTLFLGLIGIFFLDNFRGQHILQLLSFVFPMLVAALLHTDYGSCGVCVIMIMYLFKDKHFIKYFLSTLCFAYVYLHRYLWTLIISVVQYFRDGTAIQINKNLYPMFFYLVMTAIAYLFLEKYNGKQGKKLGIMKYAFYLFYPVHLAILGYIKLRLSR